MTTGITLQLYVPLSSDLEKKFQRKQFHRFPQNCKNETEHYVFNLDIKNQEVELSVKFGKILLSNYNF